MHMISFLDDLKTMFIECLLLISKALCHYGFHFILSLIIVHGFLVVNVDEWKEMDG